jgi:hypothetical protein
MIRGKETILAVAVASVALLPVASRSSTEQPKSLAQVEEFAFGGVGIAGTPSQGEQLFRSVMEQSDALATFRNILNNKGTAAAKLYALCGIRLLAPNDFQTAAEPLLKSNDTVTTIGGCMLSTQRVADVARNISSGSYDLPLKNPRFGPNQK